MQGHTDSNPRFVQNHVRMRTTNLAWETTVKKATIDSCFTLVWAHQHGIGVHGFGQTLELTITVTLHSVLFLIKLK